MRASASGHDRQFLAAPAGTCHFRAPGRGRPINHQGQQETALFAKINHAAIVSEHFLSDPDFALIAVRRPD
jgi:hypothetical protein